jgi:GTP-binding protein
MFVDRVRVKVKSGGGGNGCCSFRREAFVPRGGPNGGDGGSGGNIYFRATSRLTTLVDMRYHPNWVGKRGAHGQGKNCTGKDGVDLYLEVPCGTLVQAFESGEVLVDLTEDGQEFLAARGGQGGRGNARFVTSTNRVPRFAEKGEPGEEREYILELKVIAEVGLVGLPNAGKSTFLTAVSAARPKIGNYPFTTLSPNLGVAELSDHRILTIADIPGIIEGAAEGKGLGHDFLRHIERTRALVFVVDLGDEDPLETMNILQGELLQYNPELADRPRVYAFNKADLPENVERYEALKEHFPEESFLISAATGEGMRPLLEKLWQRVEQARQEEAEMAEQEKELLPEREYVFEAPFEIERVTNGFRVTGEKVLRTIHMTDFENEEAVVHMQRRLDKLGVFRALKRMKAQQGDAVFIGDHEMEYEE